MKSNRNWQDAGVGLVAIVIVGGIVVGLFFEIGHAPWQFIAILIALFSTLITVSNNLQIQIRNEQIPKKVMVYEEVLNFFFEIIFAEKLGHPQKTEAETIEFFSKITPTMIFWASDEVLSRFIQFRQIAENMQDNDPNSALLLIGQLLLDIRKDLGHSNNKLDNRNILGAFVINIHNIH